LIKEFTDSSTTVNLGIDISKNNYEYRGSHLQSSFDPGYFGKRGYEKIAKDYGDLLENEMIKIEFKKFKIKLGMV
jgi:hypothetical protein